MLRSMKHLRDWPVDNVAAVVVGENGVLDLSGAPDQVFALASVTKPLAAYAALVAVEEGAIELDQPAGPPGATVRHLLAHSSGLAFNSRMVQAPPGKRRIYSSAGFEVLADFIAAETGIGFSSYLRDAVFAPLGMRTADLPGSAGHGGAASITDLAAFAAELLTPRLISPQTWQDAVTVQFPGLDGVLPGYGPQRPNDWGLGLEIRGVKSPHWTGTNNSPGTVGHFGQTGTFIWADHDRKLACAVLTDRGFGDWARPLWPQFSDAVIAEAA